MDRADLIVVGAGVVGLFTAYYAARAGYNVVVLERERAGSGASGANAGVLHLIQPPPGKLRRELAPMSARRYRDIAPALGVEIIEAPLLILALNRREELLLHPLKLLIKHWLSPGTKAEVIKGREAQEIELAITPNTRKALLVEGYGIVHPPALIEALKKAVQEEGAHVEEGVSVEEITCGDNTVTVITGQNMHLKARYAVNAAGPGAQRLAEGHGVEVKVALKPGAMELYEKPKVNAVIARIPTSSKTKGGAVIPWPGETLLGPTLSEDPNYNPTPGEVAERYKPLLAEEPRGYKGTIIGYRTVARPRDFHIIRPRKCPRTVHLLGIESPGLTAAPLLAEIALYRLGIRGIKRG
ncbi:MAG: FAD-binding oxidoreductase [Desulfurococcales archaeon]|nr:FAD-binding oxidoreductase [Desulfurococcales archaeon]